MLGIRACGNPACRNWHQARLYWCQRCNREFCSACSEWDDSKPVVTERGNRNPRNILCPFCRSSFRVRVGEITGEQEETVRILIAAKEGDCHAQLQLGGMYAEGRGSIPPDEEAAAAWYRKAAEQNDAEAQYRLGRMLAEGLVASRDWYEDESWLERAAAQGHPEARKLLGKS